MAWSPVCFVVVVGIIVSRFYLRVVVLLVVRCRCTGYSVVAWLLCVVVLLVAVVVHSWLFAAIMLLLLGVVLLRCVVVCLLIR